MSRNNESPDDVYDALREVVGAEGTTPSVGISARLPTEKPGGSANSLAERFAGRVGQISSGRGGSEGCDPEALVRL
jgi:hypothetical protein